MAATLPTAKDGEYYGPQRVMEAKGPPGPSEIKPQALDADVAARLWTASQHLTDVTFA